MTTIYTGTNQQKLRLKHLVEPLHSANIVQHVKERTHISGHIIDLVVTREGQNILGYLQVSSMLSDHFVVQADLKCLLDKQASMKTKTFVQRATVPWYNQTVQAAKRARRRME